jgi:hypothetical protein
MRFLSLISVLVLSGITISLPFCSSFGQGVYFARASAAGATYLVDQDFEGAGYDNGETWTEVGSPNEDYTGVVLDGAESFRLAQSGGQMYAHVSFSALDEIWVYFLLRPITIDAATRTIASLHIGGSERVLIRVTSTGQLHYDGSGTGSTTGTMSAGNTYHVWIHYKKSTAANGVIDIGFSTDGTRPTSGNNFVQTTTDSESNQIDRLDLGAAALISQEYIFDKVRVDNAQIGDNPL